MAQAAVTAVNGMMMDDGRFIRVKLADRDKDKGVISGPPGPGLWAACAGRAWAPTGGERRSKGGLGSVGEEAWASGLEATHPTVAVGRLQTSRHGLDRSWTEPLWDLGATLGRGVLPSSTQETTQAAQRGTCCR